MWPYTTVMSFAPWPCGIAGLSVAADSLSAIKHARVSVVRDDNGLAVDYRMEGDFPKFGNNDDRVDDLAVWITKAFMDKIRENPTYRNATHTQSILTITCGLTKRRNRWHTAYTSPG